MKPAFFLSILCFCNLAASFGQGSIPSNSFWVKQNQPLQFSYEKVDDLLAEKIIRNAFSIQLGPATKSYFIYCNIVSGSAPNESVIQKIILKPSEPNNKYGCKEIQLSTKPQLVLEYKAHQVSEVLSYDAIIAKQTTWLPPANTNFSILFTLIQP